MKNNSNDRPETNFTESEISPKTIRGTDEAFCIMCGRAVKLWSYFHAAEFLKTDLAEIYKFAGKRQLHRIHNKCGTTMICSASLQNLFQNRQTRQLNPDWLPYKTADFQTGEDILK